MAEYQEVVKQFKRMCESNCDDCRQCPIESYRGFYHCWRWISEKPEKAEELIMQWAKENPPVTNRDKFKEVFGIEFSDLFRLGISRDLQKWLYKEYEEPKDE